MSLVPSEIEFQNESDAVHETARLSNLTVFVMLAILATGFASVGYLAFEEMTGRNPVLADAPRDGKTAGKDASNAFREVSTIDRQADDKRGSPETDDPILNDAAQFTIAQSSAADDDPAGLPRAPERKPSSTPTPSVVYDPAVFDDLAAEPQASPSPTPTPPAADAPGPAPDAVVDEPEDRPAPARQIIAEPPNNAPSEDSAAAPIEDPAPGPAGPPQPDERPSNSEAAVETPEETPAGQPVTTSAQIDALAGSHVVQLASYRSEAEAMADWRRIQSRHGDFLAGKAYQIEKADLGERGVFHRLRIGPFTSPDDAQSYCQGLKERGQDCLALRR